MHGDLAGGNVLLATSGADSRGFTAKVADFGLARILSATCETATFGTVRQAKRAVRLCCARPSSKAAGRECGHGCGWRTPVLRAINAGQHSLWHLSRRHAPAATCLQS